MFVRLSQIVRINHFVWRNVCNVIGRGRGCPPDDDRLRTGDVSADDLWGFQRPIAHCSNGGDVRPRSISHGKTPQSKLVGGVSFKILLKIKSWVNKINKEKWNEKRNTKRNQIKRENTTKKEEKRKETAKEIRKNRRKKKYKKKKEIYQK